MDPVMQRIHGSRRSCWLAKPALILAAAGWALLVLTTLGCGGYYLNPQYTEGVGSNPSAVSRLESRPSGPEVVTFFGLGDWGTGDRNQRIVAGLLQAEVEKVDGRARPPIVFGLGDNQYPDGLVEGWDENGVAGRQLDATLEPYCGLDFRHRQVLFHLVQGNHDHRGDVALWETLAEGRYLTKDHKSIFNCYNLSCDLIPDTNDEQEYKAIKKMEGSCMTSLPELMPCGSGLIRFIALDTQVLLDRYGERDEHLSARICIEDYWSQLCELLKQEPVPTWTVVIGHHPLRSNGVHGGVYRGKSWFSGIRSFSPKIDIQDLSHSANMAMRCDLERTLAVPETNVLYLSGHEHSLQFLRVNANLLQVVSGSAAKTTGVQGMDDTIFCDDQLGLVRFDVTDDRMWVEFVSPGEGSSPASSLFRIDAGGPYGTRGLGE